MEVELKIWTLFVAAMMAGLVATWSAVAGEPSSPGEAGEASNSVDEVVEAVEQKYAEVEALQADFVQTTHSEVFGADSQFGAVVIKRPSKMAWEFGDQEKQFITDGQTMWVYTRADNQVIKYDDVASSRSTMDQLLTSLDTIDEVFDIVIEPDDSGKIVLRLTPENQEQVKNVRLVFDPELVVKQVVITDPFDQVTEIEFSNVEFNVELADSRFEFEVPEGAEIISAGAF